MVIPKESEHHVCEAFVPQQDLLAKALSTLEDSTPFPVFASGPRHVPRFLLQCVDLPLPLIALFLTLPSFIAPPTLTGAHPLPSVLRRGAINTWPLRNRYKRLAMALVGGISASCYF